VNTVNYAASGSPQYGCYVCVEPIGANWAQQHFPTDGNGNAYRARATPDGQFELSRHTVQTYINNGYSRVPIAVRMTERPDQFEPPRLSSTNADNWRMPSSSRRCLNGRKPAVFRGVQCDGLSGDDLCAAWGRLALYRGLVDPRFRIIAHDFDTILARATRPATSTGPIWEMLLNPPARTRTSSVVLLRFMRIRILRRSITASCCG